jgi:hypothetical protein
LITLACFAGESRSTGAVKGVRRAPASAAIPARFAAARLQMHHTPPDQIMCSSPGHTQHVQRDRERALSAISSGAAGIVSSKSQTLAFHLNSEHIAICATMTFFNVYSSGMQELLNCKQLEEQNTQRTVCIAIAQHYSQFA